MTKDLFFTLDLNLLRTFLVLSQELNTRKAAERLFCYTACYQSCFATAA